MAKKSDDKLIHVKLEYGEAVQSKRDILQTQKDLIEVLRSIKRYHLLRTKELKTKELLYRRLKSLKTNINKLNKNLPKIKIPDILKHDDDVEREAKKKIEKISGEDLKQSDLEKEIADIQKKLQELE